MLRTSTLIWGMFREVTPTSRSLSTSAMATGAASASPIAYMRPAPDSSGMGSAKSGSAPSGNSVVDRASIDASTKWASIAKNSVTPTRLISVPMTFWLERVTGSKTEPMPKPICTSSMRPAMANDASTMCTPKPSSMPTNTSEATAAMSQEADQPAAPGARLPGRDGAASAERRKTSATRTIAGMPWDESAGDIPNATENRTDRSRTASRPVSTPTPRMDAAMPAMASLPPVMRGSRGARADCPRTR